ncbi:MAG: methionyl-tRNA formyltransferase [Herpetosiphonaceae bacterium]|nr:methionyl-tRNA formyltransferase [Herpetosiphonaceae bacterium]
MRILYLGTPDIAVAPLEQLHALGHTIVGVVTQPDRPAGRKRVLTAPPVKLAAERLGLPVFQPETLKDAAAVDDLRSLAPDVGVVAAYGEILRRNVLEIPPLGYLNIHPSLLPLYRGPAPVTGAIMAGDSLVGVSIIRLTAKMDAGPILAQATLRLDPAARAGELTAELMRQGGALLAEALAPYAAGELAPREQDHGAATYTQLLSKADGTIDWGHPAIIIERMTRAYDPWPGAVTTASDQPLKIISARVVARWTGEEPIGTVLRDGAGAILVATGSGALELLSVQPAGKRPMSADEWLRGLRDLPRLGDPAD